MVICHRCQIRIAQIECEICNGVFCSECDKIIHSNKPRNNHIRNQLQIYKYKENKRNIKISNIQNIDNSNSLNNLAQSNDKNNMLNSNSNCNNNSIYQTNIENNKSITIPPKIMGQDNEYKLLSETYNQPSNNIIQIERNKNIDNTQHTYYQTQIDKNMNESENKEEIQNYIDNDNTNNPPIHINDLTSNSINNKRTNNRKEKDEEIKRLQKAIE